MFKRTMIAAVLLSSAGVAHAQATFDFAGGESSPATGQAVVFDFDTTTPVIAGSNFIIQSGTNTDGAAPAFATPGGNYLSVLGNGLATITFDTAVDAFSFDWGSVDSYNTLTVFGSFGERVFTGSDFVAPANGDQDSSVTNGLFTALGNGDSFTGFTLESSTNSFEIDNVALGGAVPEPAAWAMMILGVGGIGGSLRYRRGKKASVSFA